MNYANYGIDDRIVRALKSMGYRWRERQNGVGCFLKPIGHGCLIFKDGKLEMVFESVDLTVSTWSSVAIDLGSEVSIVRQIMIAESAALDGANFDRHGETFAFLSTTEAMEVLL